MGKTIQARVSKGRLEPLEHIEADEGEVLTLTIIRLPAKAQAGGLERSAGGWKGLIDAEELKRNIYADRLISTRLEPRHDPPLRKQGQLIGDFDLLIAATCRHYGLTLLTNNRRHFDRVEGLQINSV